MGHFRSISRIETSVYEQKIMLHSALKKEALWYHGKFVYEQIKL